MKLITKYFNQLTTTELYEILKSRAEIFVVEQNCVYQDLDDIDYRSLHIFYECDGKIIAYLRAFEKDSTTKTIQMGRVLTLTHGTGLGGKLLKHIRLHFLYHKARLFYKLFLFHLSQAI